MNDMSRLPEAEETEVRATVEAATTDATRVQEAFISPPSDRSTALSEER